MFTTPFLHNFERWTSAGKRCQHSSSPTYPLVLCSICFSILFCDQPILGSQQQADQPGIPSLAEQLSHSQLWRGSACGHQATRQQEAGYPQPGTEVAVHQDWQVHNNRSTSPSVLPDASRQRPSVSSNIIYKTRHVQRLPPEQQVNIPMLCNVGWPSVLFGKQKGLRYKQLLRQGLSKDHLYMRACQQSVTEGRDQSTGSNSNTYNSIAAYDNICYYFQQHRHLHQHASPSS